MRLTCGALRRRALAGPPGGPCIVLKRKCRGRMPLRSDVLGYHGTIWASMGTLPIMVADGFGRTPHDHAQTCLRKRYGSRQGYLLKCLNLRGEMTSWPVSRVLYGPPVLSDRRTWQPFIWDDACTSPRATHPDDWPGNGLGRLAAARVIPIRSCSRWGLPGRLALPLTRWALTPPFHPYRTHRSAPGGFFLWHCPWGRPRRTLSGTVFPWSPDFPHPAAFRPLRSAAARPTGGFRYKSASLP
jgi:hypothetical protein